MSSFYENGEIIDQRKNTSNYYNNEEILGDSESISIPLEIEEGDNTMYVSLNIPTKKDSNYSARFIYDTGAEVFSLGYRLFNDLKENGLDYVDLNVSITTIGVSGVPSQNNAIIIKELKIGSYTVKNVVALVETLETANSSLLGMGFLNKFKEVKWSLIAKELVFYK
jgi:clan AA aspartic protease (TIGR02281 family)